MIKHIIDILKLAFSPEGKTIKERLYNSIFSVRHNWKTSLIVIKANIRGWEEERTPLLLNSIIEKLEDMTFPASAIQAFQVAGQELIANAIEHGCIGDTSKAINVISEVSSSFVSITVRNPKDSPISLDKWLANSKSRLLSGEPLGRGRGLQLVGKHADIFQQIGVRKLKAVIYKDRVEIKETYVDNELVLSVQSGATNPSMPRRLLDIIRKHAESDSTSFIICLDPEEYELLNQNSLKYSKRKKRRRSNVGTSVTFHLIDEGIKKLTKSQVTYKIVLGDDYLIDLLPNGLAFNSIMEAVKSLKKARKLN